MKKYLLAVLLSLYVGALLLLTGCINESEDVTRDSPYLKISIEDDADIYDMTYEIYDPVPLTWEFMSWSSGATENRLSVLGSEVNSPLSLEIEFIGDLTELTEEQITETFKSFQFSLRFADHPEDSFHLHEPLTELGKSIALIGTDGMQLDFHSYEADHLSGSVTGIMTALDYHPDCSDVDVDENELDGCGWGLQRNVYLPIEIDFRLPVDKEE